MFEQRPRLGLRSRPQRVTFSYWREQPIDRRRTDPDQLPSCLFVERQLAKPFQCRDDLCEVGREPLPADPVTDHPDLPQRGHDVLTVAPLPVSSLLPPLGSFVLDQGHLNAANDPAAEHDASCPLPQRPRRVGTVVPGQLNQRIEDAAFPFLRRSLVLKRPLAGHRLLLLHRQAHRCLLAASSTDTLASPPVSSTFLS